MAGSRGLAIGWSACQMPRSKTSAEFRTSAPGDAGRSPAACHGCTERPAWRPSPPPQTNLRSQRKCRICDCNLKKSHENLHLTSAILSLPVKSFWISLPMFVLMHSSSHAQLFHQRHPEVSSQPLLLYHHRGCSYSPAGHRGQDLPTILHESLG